jgi:hypothetical protein
MADDVQFPIEAGHVMLFRRAVGYPDADTSSAVPPTFAVASAQFDPGYPLRPQPGEQWFGSGKNPTSAARGDDDDAGPPTLHAEQHFEYHRPVRIGETLTVTSEPGKTWEREGRAGLLKFSERFTHYRDADGNDVVTGRSVGVQVHRKPESD